MTTATKKFVQAEPKGCIHDVGCFIVTTRWSDLPWQPCSGPATCAFCVKKEGQRCA